jgi:hypothetical protein
MEQATEQANTSGRGKESVVPPEIRGWNWGAFFLNWIWGLGNSTYIALLMFVPFVNFVMPFVLGAKGNEWAWRNRVWRDVEHFKKTQRKWGWAALVILVVVIPSCIGSIMMTLKQSEAYQLSFSEIQRNEEVKASLGEPITSGIFVSGSISTSGPDGKASLQYSLTGPKSDGKAFVYATKHAGRWTLAQVVVDVPKAQKRIAVVGSE